MSKIPGNWTAVPDLLLGIGFDIYEIIIISSVQSWTRQDMKFYESVTKLSNEYGCDRKTLGRRFKKLEDLGILKKGKKKGHGQYEYSVNELLLINIIKERKATCTLEVQPDEKAVPQGYNTCTSDDQNKNTKTSSKTSFRVEENTLGVSSPSDEDIKLLAHTLDI
jgi:DNA-binding HxlR family transcriptional regulator